MTLEGGVRWLVAVFVADSEIYSLGALNNCDERAALRA
jgi:hypothetical protein